MGKDLNNNSILATGYQRKGIAYFYYDDLSKSTSFYKKTLQLSQQQGKTATTAAMELNISQNYEKLGMMDSALYFSEKAKSNFGAINDRAGLGSVYHTLGVIRGSQGYHQLALENAISAAKIFESVKDSLRWSDANSLIAQSYLKMKDSTSAEPYFRSAMELYKRKNDKHYQCLTMTNLAALLFKRPEKQLEADSLLMESISIAKKIKGPIYESLAYLIQGGLYQHQGKFADAENNFLKSQTISDSTGNRNHGFQARLGLAGIYVERGQTAKADELLEKILRNMGSEIGFSLKSKAFRLQSTLKSKLGKPVAALASYQNYKGMNDSIFNIENGNRFRELQIMYETEKKEAALVLQEKEIQTLNQEVEISNLRKGLYMGGMASALALFGLSVFGYRQRIKKNRIAREKQEAIYKQEIAHKKKELASQTLHLVQKNTFLDELKENLENLKSSPDKFKMEFRRIVMLLKKEKASDKDWETFKTYFSEVHNDFDQKLKTLYADISEKEIRLAAFLRMNLTTKEIAATMNVLPDSILKSKYRLKKKLDLGKDIDLVGFLNTL
ncbi:tetratricopeptide repeat protein [Flagellimonas sp. DF-77]|uniref:tetratricopeptide repeat protein n=1 Tax=Flagellimonas algarum TaxID=3230298 RepID=UPI00339A3E65